jgi:hypothetical protein
VTVNQNPASYTLLELILRSAGVTDTEDLLAFQPEVLEDR